MSDERDDELLRSLGTLGAGYDPDVTAINRRLNAGRPATHRSTQRRSSDSSGPDRRPNDRRPTPTVIRHSQALLVPALAVLLVVGGIVAVVSHGSPALGWNHPPIVPIAAAPTPTLNPITPTDRELPAKQIEATNPAVATPTTPTTTPRSQDPTTTGSRPDQADTATVRADVLSSSATRAVDLGPGLVDWVAVGVRRDLRQVRAETSSPLVTVDQPAGSTSEPGPFRISWSDGQPEEDHQDAGDWLQSTDPLEVTVAASDHSRTVVLQAGTAGSRARLSIDGSDVSSSHTAIGAASSSPRGVVVTVKLPATTGSVNLKLVPGEANSKIYLAAVSIR
jgi:hypothetical protein